MREGRYNQHGTFFIFKSLALTVAVIFVVEIESERSPEDSMRRCGRERERHTHTHTQIGREGDNVGEKRIHSFWNEFQVRQIRLRYFPAWHILFRIPTLRVFFTGWLGKRNRTVPHLTGALPGGELFNNSTSISRKLTVWRAAKGPTFPGNQGLDPC